MQHCCLWHVDATYHSGLPQTSYGTLYRQMMSVRPMTGETTSIYRPDKEEKILLYQTERGRECFLDIFVKRTHCSAAQEARHIHSTTSHPAGRRVILCLISVRFIFTDTWSTESEKREGAVRERGKNRDNKQSNTQMVSGARVRQFEASLRCNSDNPSLSRSTPGALLLLCLPTLQSRASKGTFQVSYLIFSCSFT